MSDFNTIKPNPQLRDVLDIFRRDLLLSINCHAIATVQSVNTTISEAHPRQTLIAKINYSKTYIKTLPNGSTSEYQRDYPVLMDCPFVVLGGGSSSLTFPIAAGDQCLILFNDRDLSNWFSGGFAGPVATQRLHAFTDGIALVGLNVATNYDTTRAVLQNGTTMVGVGTSKVKIANAAETLNGLLQELMTVVGNLAAGVALITVTPGSLAGPSSPPLNAATFTGMASTISELATDIGELLE